MFHKCVFSYNIQVQTNSVCGCESNLQPIQNFNHWSKLHQATGKHHDSVLQNEWIQTCYNRFPQILWQTLLFSINNLNTNIIKCYSMPFPDLAANISYTLKLDAKRYNHRAYFLPKNRVLSNVVNVTLEEVCKDHPFLIEVSHELVSL